ncbi:hypothetical protein J6590_051591 [Homalodisca vitripennis]|nr:hypothetical protein J6590_051591 [Homalodisca vitripennis]
MSQYNSSVKRRPGYKSLKVVFVQQTHVTPQSAGSVGLVVVLFMNYTYSSITFLSKYFDLELRRPGITDKIRSSSGNELCISGSHGAHCDRPGPLPPLSDHYDRPGPAGLFGLYGYLGRCRVGRVHPGWNGPVARTLTDCTAEIAVPHLANEATPTRRSDRPNGDRTDEEINCVSRRGESHSKR